MTPRRTLIINDRDRDLLRLFDRTLATAAQVLKAGECFTEPFSDLRRTRERLQALSEGGWVRSSLATATTSRPAGKYYQLTADGYRLLYGPDVPHPAKDVFAPIAPSRYEHSMLLADIVVHTMVSAKHCAVSILADEYLSDPRAIRLSVFLYVFGWNYSAGRAYYRERGRAA